MFLFTPLAGVAGAVTLAATSPAMAGAPPVSVVSCDYEKLPVRSEGLIPGPAPIDENNLRITFVNQAPLAATDVRFAVQYAGSSQVVDAAGTFASETPITKDFAPSISPAYDGSAACTVQSVTFSDGSTWQPA